MSGDSAELTALAFVDAVQRNNDAMALIWLNCNQLQLAVSLAELLANQLRLRDIDPAEWVERGQAALIGLSDLP